MHCIFSRVFSSCPFLPPPLSSSLSLALSPLFLSLPLLPCSDFSIAARSLWLLCLCAHLVALVSARVVVGSISGPQQSTTQAFKSFVLMQSMQKRACRETF